MNKKIRVQFTIIEEIDATSEIEKNIENYNFAKKKSNDDLIDKEGEIIDNFIDKQLYKKGYRNIEIIDWWQVN